jgi:hypothetical protein
LTRGMVCRHARAIHKLLPPRVGRCQRAGGHALQDRTVGLAGPQGDQEGDAFDTQIEEAIAQTRVVIVIWCARGSGLCARQAQAVADLNRLIRAASAVHADSNHRLSLLGSHQQPPCISATRRCTGEAIGGLRDRRPAPCRTSWRPRSATDAACHRRRSDRVVRRREFITLLGGIGSGIDLIDDLEVGENLPRRKLFDFLLVQAVEPIEERLVRRQFRMLFGARHGDSMCFG